jgi:hypothetical protein
MIQEQVEEMLDPKVLKLKCATCGTPSNDCEVAQTRATDGTI